MSPGYKTYRRSFDHSYTLGVYPTLELLIHQPKITSRVILDRKGAKNQGVAKIRSLCRKQGIEIIESDRLVEKLSRRGNTYAVGVFQKESQPVEFQKNHLVLIHPASMGNLGTIMRTMAGYENNDLVIIEPAADPFDPRVVRASMGAIFQLRLSRYDQFADYWGTFPGHHLYPLMTDGEQPLPGVDFQPPWALIFGEESSGLGKEYHQYGTSIRIPHSEAVDSLNLAVAVGVCLYQTRIGNPDGAQAAEG
jgi:TrmH family RNA methyltransferase